MNRSVQRVVFVVVANLIGVTAVLFATEFAIRWHAEKGFVLAWRSFFTTRAQFPELRTGHWIVADPDLGFRLNPAQPGISSLGIRNPEIPAAKTPGVPRVIFLGDSVAADPQGFVEILRERLKTRVEVINAAITGYTTYQERRLLERDLLVTRPDLVIVQYCVNDNHQFLHRYDEQARMLYTEEAWRALVPQGSGPFSRLTRHSYLAFRVRLAMFRLRPPSGVYPWENMPDVVAAWQDEPWEAFKEHLIAMRDHVQRAGGRLAVVMAPFRPQLDPALVARNPPYVLKPQKRMAEICSAAGVPLLDLFPVMAERGGESLLIDNYHFSAAGHRLAADTLLEFLRSHDILRLR